MSDTSFADRPSLGRAAAGFVAVAAVPAALAAFYYYGLAADRYVTEVRYSVRSGAVLAQDGPGGIGGPLGGGGALLFAGDSFILENYLRSVQAVVDVERTVPLRRMLAADGGDPVRAFAEDMPLERLIDYWRAAVRPRFDAVTGITTVEIAFYAPEDAEAVGRALVAALERVVDSLTERSRLETLAYVNAEFDRAARDLEAARDEIEAFRRANFIISPAEQVTIGSSIIATLSSQLSERRVTLRLLRDRAPNSPLIPGVEGEIDALQNQLDAEVKRRGGVEGAALPAQLSSFDALQNEYEIARDAFVSALSLRQQAEAAATLGQAELVVFVMPRAPMVPTEPNRPLAVLQVFGVGFALWLVGRILMASLRL